MTCPLTNFIFSTWPCNTCNIFVTTSKSGKYIYVNIWKHLLVNLEDSDTCSHKRKFVALWSLLVFVVMSGRLSSDSRSGSEPDESESLNISWYISCSLSSDSSEAWGSSAWHRSSFSMTTTSQTPPFISFTWVVISDLNFLFHGRVRQVSK